MPRSCSVLYVACLAAAVINGGPSKAAGAEHAQPRLGSHTIPLIHAGGARFRDLNRDGVLQPYEDWRLSVPVRAADLLSRMTLAEKAGAMMHGTPPTTQNDDYDLGAVKPLILQSNVTAFITH